MSRTVYVLDSSAVLCIYFGETGADRVHELAKGALISAVNLTEVFSKLQDRRVLEADVNAVMSDFDVEVVPFDHQQAIYAGKLRNKTRSLGLSLGDRACLALAAERNAVAVTTDRAWSGLDDIAHVLFVR